MGDSDKLGGHECENWEIRVKTPTPALEGLTGLDTGPGENMKLSPRVSGDREEERGETINMDECWTINIKVEEMNIHWSCLFLGFNCQLNCVFIQAPASLNIDTGDPDEEGFAVIIIFVIFVFISCNNELSFIVKLGGRGRYLICLGTIVKCQVH